MIWDVDTVAQLMECLEERDVTVDGAEVPGYQKVSGIAKQENLTEKLFVKMTKVLGPTRAENFDWSILEPALDAVELDGSKENQHNIRLRVFWSPDLDRIVLFGGVRDGEVVKNVRLQSPFEPILLKSDPRNPDSVYETWTMIGFSSHYGAFVFTTP